MSRSLREWVFQVGGGAGQSVLGPRRLLFRGELDTVLHLTYDDGPDPRNTLGIADTLSRANAIGTFFFTGVSAREHPDVVRQVASAGHAVGHHTYSHLRLPGLSPTRAKSEWLDGRAALEDTLGAPCTLFRPPFGLVPPWLLPEVWRAGDTVVLWSFSTRDYTGEPCDALWDRIALLGVVGRKVVLMHDWYDDALRMTARILKLASVRGLTAAGIDTVVSAQRSVGLHHRAAGRAWDRTRREGKDCPNAVTGDAPEQCDVPSAVPALTNGRAQAPAASIRLRSFAAGSRRKR